MNRDNICKEEENFDIPIVLECMYIPNLLFYPLFIQIGQSLLDNLPDIVRINMKWQIL